MNISPGPPRSASGQTEAFEAAARTRRVRSRRHGSLVAAAGAFGLLLLCWPTAGARAIDIEPKDYVPAPSGTNLIALYSLIDDFGPLDLAGGPTIRGRTGVQSVLEIFRYIHYGDLMGRSFAVQLVVPTGTTQGEIAGQQLASDRGLGDVLAAAGVSLLPHPRPDLNLAIVSYTSLPTGSYEPERQLNFGANRWSEDVQLGYTQGIGRAWFDLAADMVVYGANPDSGPNHQTLLQEPTYQLQSWLSYEVDQGGLFSVGYSALLGGTESTGGVQNGLKTQSQQIRAAFTQFVSPSLQVLGSISHDVYVVGGFRETFGLTIRLTHFF